MNQENFQRLRENAVTIFGGQLLDKKSYILFKKVIQYLDRNDYYIITGGLSVKKSVMYEPIKLADNKVITVYSEDDHATSRGLIITDRILSYTAKNFGDQIYQMIQSKLIIVFDGGLSTLGEMILALDFWKRYNGQNIKKPVILFFSRKWLSYREDFLEDNLVDAQLVRQYFLYCKKYSNFVDHFENFFPQPPK
jgi:predicted Rossmann-fold nucleotide-binding protein